MYAIIYLESNKNQFITSKENELTICTDAYIEESASKRIRDYIQMSQNNGTTLNFWCSTLQILFGS